MGAELEIVSLNRQWHVGLDADRVTIGSAAENTVTVDDTTVSRLHGLLERFEAGWCISDLGSSNGTWLNSQRIWSKQRLHDGDEVRLGQTRLVFHDGEFLREPVTEVEDAPPSVTTHERDVLVALCRPLLARDMFTEPASTRSIAGELVVSEAAVKQHLTKLYVKFGVASDDERRRLRLANEAIRRGSVTIRDLRPLDP